MDGVQGLLENRFATIVDLQKLLIMIETKFAYLDATNNSKCRNPHATETNNDIQDLFQEIMRL